jgi:hypothetical protein
MYHVPNSIALADCLFVCQDIYDVNGYGRQMAENVSHLMGHWHLLKQASLQIWRIGAPYFFGPFWHECFPSSKFYEKPSFKIIDRFLSLFRSAYPEVRAALVAALARSDCK